MNSPITSSPHIILGIESSCDETAVAIISYDPTTREKKVLGNLMHSQIAQQQEYGGVVPELAARAHLEKIHTLAAQAIEAAKIKLSDLSAIATTAGPGLIGGVVVGTMFAKGLAATLNKPFIAVNHLEGHALTARLTHDVAFPYLLLLVSGGHCQFLEVRGVGKYHLLGGTIDDAIGEAFDKVARVLNLPYPGGPKIEALAQSGNPHAFDLPRPLLGRPGCDFSLSGLKTAVRQLIQKHPDAPSQDVAASFQQVIIDCIVDRSKNAIAMASKDIKSFVVGGGVAANQSVYKALEQLTKEYDLAFYAPPPNLCTDNAAMIAWTGLEYFLLGRHDDLSFEPRPRWPLSSLS